jgi:uncharacterized DUF497 family protein
MAGEFEWDRTKAAANYKKHGVRFEHAVLAFEDAFALVELDKSEDYGEDRVLLTGCAAGRHSGCGLYRTRRAHPHYIGTRGDRV